MSCDFFDLANPGVIKLTPYQAGKPIDELRRELGVEDIIKLASNENPLGASPKAIAAIQHATDHCQRYPDSRCHYLTAALAEFHQITSDRILTGNGSDHLLSLIAQAFLNDGDEVIISEYAFATFGIVSLAHHATPVIIPAKNWGHDLTAMAAAVNEKTRLLFIANPNNPTATWVNEKTLQDFLQQLPETVILVVDEAYIEYANNPSFPNTIALQEQFPNLMTTRTFSKAYGLAGLRVGYCIADPSCIDVLSRIRLPFSVNQIAQVAAIAALDDPEHIVHSINVNQMGHKQLCHSLRQLGLYDLPTVCNFITVDMKQAALPIYQQLLQHGIIVRPLIPYGLENHLRITIGTEEENSRLIHALEKILQR